jgi:spore coat protein U-like protein
VKPTKAFYRLLRNFLSAANCAAITANSELALAISISLLALATASSAAFFAASALASSISSPRIAVSARTVTRLGCTSKMPLTSDLNTHFAWANARNQRNMRRVNTQAAAFAWKLYVLGFALKNQGFRTYNVYMHCGHYVYLYRSTKFLRFVFSTNQD